MNRFRAWLRLKMGWIPRTVRRIIISVIGGTVLLLVPLGILLPIMPGWIFLPLALAILAVEFAWAARWLKKIRRTAGNVQERVRGSRWWWWGGPSAEAAKRENAARKEGPDKIAGIESRVGHQVEVGGPAATRPMSPPNAAKPA